MGFWNKPSLPGGIMPGTGKIPGVKGITQVVEKVKQKVKKITPKKSDISKIITPKIKPRRK